MMGVSCACESSAPSSSGGIELGYESPITTTEVLSPTTMKESMERSTAGDDAAPPVAVP
jgi:hypothetical protein